MSYDFSKISCVETESDLEKPENAEFNKTIKKSWESKKPNDNMKSPKNCVFVTPKVNLELWKLLSSWQRKSDVKFMSIQKSLVRTMNASLSILSKIYSGDFSMQIITQKTTDTLPILGEASHELSLARRVFIRSIINSEYKDLYSNSQPVTEFLFGDNLSQVIKELNLTNKLGSRPINKHSYSRNKSYARIK